MQSVDPGGHPGDGFRRVRGPHPRRQVDPLVCVRDPLAVPGAATADRDLDLHGRLEPVDVRAVEQADLDESHGARRIPSRVAVGMGQGDRPTLAARP